MPPQTGVTVLSMHLSKGIKRSALFIALGMCVAGGVSAQSNITGQIFGHAPAGQGTTIVVQNLETGLTRTMTVGADGNYRIAALPNGKYKVTLQKDGAVIST